MTAAKNAASLAAEAEAARMQARATLPRFWDAYARPQWNEAGFALALGGADADRIWVSDIRRLPSGRIAARCIATEADGEPIEFAESEVADWMFLRDGKWVGVWTMRPQIARMPHDLAARCRARYEALQA